MRPREITAFLAVAFALCCVLLGDALIGRSMLAPLDIAAAQWPQYRFVDPASNGIPKNHHVVDQLGYDLPLQWTIYHAWRRGEVPWWDPFTYAGRPLLADAHASAADPVRVLSYLVLPRFEWAYHWTRTLHFLLGGLGIFCLLRRLSVGATIAGGTGLLAMCAGSNILFFGHPWISASFLYYPWLWIAWHQLWEKGRPSATIAAPVLAACAIYAGNLQSHAYLPLFGVAFCAGYAGRNWREWRRALAIVVPTGVLAALLAAPVLGPELELFTHNLRPVQTAAPAYRFFDGPLIFSAVWPWSLGTFRSLTRWNLGFHVFIGTAGFILALIGSRSKNCAVRCGVVLVIGFVAIMTVPTLAALIYARAAGLATLGVLVLAAFGAETLALSVTKWRRSAWLTAVFAVLVALGTAAVVWGIYPRLKPRLLTAMEAHTLDDGSEGRSLPLRRAQVENYPSEISFGNPEVLAAWLTLPALALIFAVPRWRRFGIPAVLALNLVAPVLYARRFIPRVPIEQWQRLLAGGPAQRQARALLEPRHLRLNDEAGAGFSSLFPQELAHLYGVHVIHGYAALIPPNLAWSSLGATFADYQLAGGKLEPTERCGTARFFSPDTPPRTIAIADESLNTITLEIGDGPAGALVRTDTRYPGWQAATTQGQSLALSAEGSHFTRIELPAGPLRIRLRYEPSGYRWALALAILGLAGTVLWSRKQPAAPACA